MARDLISGAPLRSSGSFLFFSFLSFVSFSFSKQVSQDELVTHSLKINANFSKGHEHPRGRIGSAW